MFIQFSFFGEMVEQNDAHSVFLGVVQGSVKQSSPKK
jgi:hypothetical protein